MPEISSTKIRTRLLIVEDSEDDAFFLVRTLTTAGFDVDFKRVETALEMRQAIEKQSWDAVISDYQMPNFDGLAALEIYKEFALDLPFIIVSGAIGDEMAVNVMKAGAHDYILKNNLARLVPVIERELQEARLRQERREALQKLQHSESRYRAIVEDQTEMINRSTLDGLITFVNDAYARLHERTPASVIGKKYSDFMTEAGANHLAEIRSALTIKRPVATNVSNHQKKDGSIIWIQWRDRLIFDANNKPVEYQGVGRDITEQRQAEDELKGFASNFERRAIQLQVAAEIARDATSIRELDDLLQRAVNLARDRFNFYHVAVFLIDETDKYAMLKAASGEAGRKMIEMGHKLQIGEEGIVGYVAGIGEPHIALDVDIDSVHHVQPLLSKTRSEMALPLKVSENIIGVLDVQSEKEIAFDHDDVQTIQTMADQLAIAIDNLRLLAEVQHRANELESLYNAALVTSSELEITALLNRLYEQVQGVISFDSFIVALYEEEKGTVDIALAFENGEPIKAFQGLSVPFEEGGISSHVLKTRQSLLVANLESDKLPMEPVRDPNEDQPTLAWLGVPMIARDQVLGVVSVQSYRAGTFDESHQRFLESLAAQVAITFENARLFEAERSAREQAETLREIARVISGSIELDRVLNLILGQIKRVLVFNTASVLLFDEQNETALVAGLGYYDEKSTSQKASILLKDSAILRSMSENLESIIIPDVRHHPDWIWVPGAENVRSFLGVPIIAREKMIGAFMVDRLLENAFSDEDARTVQAVAQHMAIAIETVRLFEAERYARERAEALREAAQVISSTLSLNQVIEVVLEQMARVISYDSGSVILVEGDRAYVQAGYGYENIADNAFISEIEFDMDVITIRQIVQDAQPLMIPDVLADNRWKHTAVTGHVHSWMGVPLLVRDQVVGIINLERKVPGGFSDEEISLAQVFAAHTSTSIENARLFETEGKRAEELETLQKVSLSLTSSLEPDAVLAAILKGVFKLMPRVWHTNIFLYNKDKLIFGAERWEDERSKLNLIPLDENSPIYSVALSGEMITIPEFPLNQLFEDLDGEDFTGTLIGLPLKIGERITGVMNIVFIDSQTISASKLRIINLLSDQAALAIENARLFKQTITERRHIALLYDVGRAIATSLEPESILKEALALTSKALGGNIGAAWLYFPDEKNLRLQAFQNTIKESALDIIEINNPKMELGVGLVGWVAKEKTAINIENFSEDPRWIPVPYIDDDVLSMIAAPIVERENLLGVLAVQHHQPGAFDDDHLDLLEAICQQVSLALSNARRYQDVDRLVSLLAAEQYRLEGLIEMLPVGVLLLDDKHNQLVTNSLAREIIRDLAPDYDGFTISQLGEYQVSDLLKQHLAPLPIEISVDEPYNKIFEVEAQAIQTETPQWIVTLREVTHEREIQERVQMQERLATVGQLAAGIAHDFNNIMAAIIVYADLLLMDKTLSSSSQERLTIIQQQVQRAASLIRQILDFSRRSVMEQNDLDLLPFLKETKKLLNRTLPETITVELVSQEDEYMLSADPTRLQQVFMNLAVNARDAMPEGGILCFELSHLHLSPGDVVPTPDILPGNWISIRVRDSGLGISIEDQSHIFEPFFTTKPVGQGTGLGLAQVYGIIKQHGGYIDLESQVGEGTHFNIYLPALSKPKTESKIENSSTEIDGDGKTVLLVEDDYATRKALKTMLTLHNYHVLVAENGVDALDHLESNAQDIVLMVSDIVMPQMGGFDLYTKMQKRWPEIEVLFITGHPLDDQNQQILQQGKVHWLQKPFTIQEFNQFLIELMN